MVVELKAQNNSGVTIICNGYFLDIGAFKGLEFEKQEELAPEIVVELQNYIDSKKENVARAKKLNSTVYNFLSNKDLMKVVKKEWEKRIKDLNTTKSGKPRKQKISPEKEFEVKNQVLDEVAKAYSGSIGLWNSYDFWNVQAELHSTQAKEYIEQMEAIISKEPIQLDWLEEAQKDLKINLGE